MLSAIMSFDSVRPPGSQPLGELGPAAKDARLHRTLGHAGQLGDLCVGAAEDVVEDDRDAIALVQRVQRLLEFAGKLLVGEAVRGSAGSGGSSAGDPALRPRRARRLRRSGRARWRRASRRGTSAVPSHARTSASCTASAASSRDPSTRAASV